MSDSLALIGAMLLAVQSVTPVQPSPEEILVLGERMRRLKLITKTDRKTGTTRCIIKRSSRDPLFDAQMCDATLLCAKSVRTVPQMNTCLEPHVRRIARKSHHSAKN